MKQFIFATIIALTLTTISACMIGTENQPTEFTSKIEATAISTSTDDEEITDSDDKDIMQIEDNTDKTQTKHKQPRRRRPIRRKSAESIERTTASEANVIISDEDNQTNADNRPQPRKPKHNHKRQDNDNRHTDNTETINHCTLNNADKNFIYSGEELIANDILDENTANEQSSQTEVEFKYETNSHINININMGDNKHTRRRVHHLEQENEHLRHALNDIINKNDEQEENTTEQYMLVK